MPPLDPLLSHPCAPLQPVSSALSPQSYEEKELLRLIYFGGIQHEIRKSVWPFLLGHYQFGMLEAERKEVSLVENIWGPELFFKMKQVCILLPPSPGTFMLRVSGRASKEENLLLSPRSFGSPSGGLWGLLPCYPPVSLAGRWTCRPAPTMSKPWPSGWAARPSSGSGRRSHTQRPWPSAPRGPAWTPTWGP